MSSWRLWRVLGACDWSGSTDTSAPCQGVSLSCVSPASLGICSASYISDT